jgi:hypothetical protein
MVPMLDLCGKELGTKLFVSETTDMRGKVTIFQIFHAKINFRSHNYPSSISDSGTFKQPDE